MSFRTQGSISSSTSSSSISSRGSAHRDRPYRHIQWTTPSNNAHSAAVHQNTMPRMNANTQGRMRPIEMSVRRQHSVIDLTDEDGASSQSPIICIDNQCSQLIDNAPSSSPLDVNQSVFLEDSDQDDCTAMDDFRLLSASRSTSPTVPQASSTTGLVLPRLLPPTLSRQNSLDESLPLSFPADMMGPLDQTIMVDSLEPLTNSHALSDTETTCSATPPWSKASDLDDAIEDEGALPPSFESIQSIARDAFDNWLIMAPSDVNITSEFRQAFVLSVEKSIKSWRDARSSPRSQSGDNLSRPFTRTSTTSPKSNRSKQREETRARLQTKYQ